MKRRYAVRGLLGVTLCIANGIALADDCVVWTQQPVSGPSARWGAAMTYDESRKLCVLFGGYDGTAELGDTWEWNGGAWAQRASEGPPPRGWPAMAFDARRAVTVLFGGAATTHFGDTWEWDGSTWSLRATTGPSPRGWHGMTYDSARGVVVLFGGYGGAHCGDTWEWDRANWALRAEDGPSPRRAARTLAYDAACGVSVLFGGYDGTNRGDTWEWNGSVWTLRSTTGPAPRSGHALVYDARQGVTVMYGGRDAVTFFTDTWNWNGSTWSWRAGTGPSGRSEFPLAYDNARSAVVLFGGWAGPCYDDTWELESRAPWIAGQPESQTVAAGQVASFAVSAQSPSPVTYQWRKDAVPLVEGENVSGVYTSTLTLNPARLRDAGAYDVIVQNDCGAVTSTPASLAVRRAGPVRAANIRRVATAQTDPAHDAYAWPDWGAANRIVFEAHIADPLHDRWDLITCDPDGQNRQLIPYDYVLNVGWGMPRFTRDASKIVGHVTTDWEHPFRMNADGSAIELLNIEGTPPSWWAWIVLTPGPSAERALAGGATQLREVDLGAGTTVWVRPEYGAGDYCPDGDIIVASTGTGENLVLLNDGGEWLRDIPAPPNSYYPSWSPRANLVTFQSQTVGEPFIYVVNLDTLGESFLTTGRVPRWSPNGRSIVFQRNYLTSGGSPADIWRLDLALAGDLDCSGQVDFDDINPFVTALVSQVTYEARYPGCPWLNADVDGDGSVDFDDINPFVACLVGGGCP